MIENVRRQTTATILELSPDPALTDLFLLETDALNLKILIKARLLGSAEPLFVEGGLFTRDQLAAMTEAQSYGDLPQAMADALTIRTIVKSGPTALPLSTSRAIP